LLDNITPAESGPVLITSSQGNTTSHRERWVRVTASTTKILFACASQEGFTNLVNQQLRGKPVQTVALLYGCDIYIMAQEAFHSVIEKEIAGFQVAETGMWINRQYPGIGASPDGLLFYPVSNTKGVLEIKCPMSIKNIDPKKVDKFLTGKKLASFCLKRDRSNIQKLKTNHPYYFQMQIQMSMCEMQWGYFVV